MDKVKKVLLGLVAFFAAVAYFFYSKNRAAGGLLENQETKEKLNTLDKDIAKNKGLQEAEEEKRKQIEENMKKEENKNVSNEDIERFFNDKPDSK